MFVAEDLADAQARFDSWELSATGPIFGAKMRWAEHESLEQETATLQRAGLSVGTLDGLKREGPGTRRPARIRVRDPQMSEDSEGVMVTFTLPAGSYATVVLRELLLDPRTDHIDNGDPGGDSDPGARG